MELIIAIIILVLIIAFIKKTWKLLILAGTGYLVYLWPIPTLSAIFFLLAVHIIATAIDNATTKKMLAIINDKKIVDLDQLAKITGKKHLDIERALEKQEKEGGILRDVVIGSKGDGDKILYKSKDYMTSQRARVINFD